MNISKSSTNNRKLMKSIKNIGWAKAIYRWWKEFRKGKMGVAGLIVLTVMLILVILAPVLAGYPPLADGSDHSQAPSLGHLFGTTNNGQDIFSQLLYAGRTSLLIGVVTALIIIIVGCSVGLTAGYFGGVIDEILMRTADVLLVLPRLPLLIVLAYVMGSGILNIIIVIAVLGWTRPARQIRALTLSLKQYQYVESAKAKGAGSLHIIWNHIFPNVSGVVLAHFILEVVAVILMETGLSFLGFGDPLRPSWGYMLHMAQYFGAFSTGMWWWWFPPGLCICFLCLGMAFIGTNLNDRFVLRLGRGGRR
ncbi:MAG: ABC transporter permease [Chloroflexi bacterium]|nr:ABC transporter permease [Chloroflexota bacterium]